MRRNFSVKLALGSTGGTRSTYRCRMSLTCGCACCPGKIEDSRVVVLSPRLRGGVGIAPDTSSMVFPNVSVPPILPPVKNACSSRVSRKSLQGYDGYEPCWQQDGTTRDSRQAGELSPERLKRIQIRTLRRCQAWPARCRCRHSRTSCGRYRHVSSVSRSRSQTMVPVAGGQIGDRVATWNGGTKEKALAPCASGPKNLNIPGVLPGVAGGGIVVCDCAAFCFPCLLSS